MLLGWLIGNGPWIIENIFRCAYGEGATTDETNDLQLGIAVEERLQRDNASPCPISLPFYLFTPSLCGPLP